MCLYCEYCRFPRSANDNGGACKCKIMKHKTIDVWVSGGGTPEWCPLKKKYESEGVKYGKWLMPLTDEPWKIGYFCRCSVCNYIDNGHTLKAPPYCENCGSKMSESEGEDDK